MKKLFVIIFLSLVSLTCMKDLHAQPSAGIAVGTGWSRLSGTETGHENDFSLGLTCKFRLPLGFALQPYLMYQTRNTAPIATGQGDTFDFRQSSIELPVSLQWGPDLLLFRPYVDITPFVGYTLSNKITTTSENVRNSWAGMERLGYGVGLGAGLEIWKIQVVARYNWNLGPLYNSDGKVNVGDLVSEAKYALKNKNFNCVTVTAAVLF